MCCQDARVVIQRQGDGQRIAVSQSDRPYCQCVLAPVMATAWIAGAILAYTRMISNASVTRSSDDGQFGLVVGIVLVSIVFLFFACAPVILATRVLFARDTTAIFDASSQTVRWHSTFWLGHCLTRRCGAARLNAKVPIDAQLSFSAIESIEARDADAKGGSQVLLRVNSSTVGFESDVLLVERCFTDAAEAKELVAALAALVLPSAEVGSDSEADGLDQLESANALCMN